MEFFGKGLKGLGNLELLKLNLLENGLGDKAVNIKNLCDGL